MSEDHAIGNALREVRQLLGISQNELAKRAGLDQAQISKWEHGAVNPRPKMIRRLCKALGVHPLAFASEIAHYRAVLAHEKPTEIEFTTEKLPGDILSVSVISRIDLQKNKRFIETVFGTAKEMNCRKILMNLSRSLCHFTPEEQVKGAQHGLRWMEEHSFHPTVAVIANDTLSRLGASIVQEANHPVEVFKYKLLAEQWLERH